MFTYEAGMWIQLRKCLQCRIKAQTELSLAHCGIHYDLQ